MSSKNVRKNNEADILRKYFSEFDDDTIRSLTNYYNVEDSDKAKFLRYIKSSRSIPALDAA